jgi:uncharacterized protein YjbI with pentapeptide repeats
MKSFTNELKKQIDIRIKNGIDISDLIKDVDIRGQDFSRAIIKELNIVNGDISNAMFFDATIGQENTITNLSGTKMNHTNFKQARLLGETWLTGADARNSIFTSAYMPYPKFNNANFKGANFCGIITKIQTHTYKGAKFDVKFIQDLANMLNLKVTITEGE